MRISVIIPVYNAERYVAEAVGSALLQPETAEVLLVEDGSRDNSLVICQGLAEKHERVRLLRHPGGVNKGISATRNLGLRQAQSEWIAFLDADDFMMPGRFKPAVERINEDDSIDGVYDAVGTRLEGDEAAEWWAHNRGDSVMTTIRQAVDPEDLLGCLCVGGNGCFHTNGIVFRRELLSTTGLFDPELRVAEDILMWRKLAAVGKLVAGRLDRPVAMRRVHGSNTIIKEQAIFVAEEHRMRVKLLKWSIAQKLSRRNRELVRKTVTGGMPGAKPIARAAYWYRFRELIRLIGLLRIDLRFINDSDWRWVLDNLTGWSLVKGKILQLIRRH